MIQTDRLFNGLLVLDTLYRYGEVRISGSFVEKFLKSRISRQKNLLFRLNPGLSRRKSHVFPPMMAPLLEELELLTKLVAAKVLPEIQLAVACIPEERMQAFEMYESSRVPKVPVRVLAPAGEYLYQAIRALSRGAIAVAFCQDRGLLSEHASIYLRAAEDEFHHAVPKIVRIEKLLRRSAQVVIDSTCVPLSVPEELEFRRRCRIRNRKLAACEVEGQDSLDLPASGQSYCHRGIDLRKTTALHLLTLFPPGR